MREERKTLLGVKHTVAVKEDPEVVPLLVLLELFVSDDTFCGHCFCEFLGVVRWKRRGGTKVCEKQRKNTRANPDPRISGDVPF